MSSEVETPRGATPRIATGFFDFARNDTTADGARSLFEELDIYDDMSPHSAAMNMAIDEALLECAAASIHPLLSLAVSRPVLRLFWEIFRRRNSRQRAGFSPALDRRRDCFARRRPHLLDCNSVERSGFRPTISRDLRKHSSRFGSIFERNWWTCGCRRGR